MPIITLTYAGNVLNTENPLLEFNQGDSLEVVCSATSPLRPYHTFIRQVTWRYLAPGYSMSNRVGLGFQNGYNE
ncbi:MAG: hypothetical protein FD188_3429, partial [Ignavibacteria bacterium]